MSTALAIAVALVAVIALLHYEAMRRIGAMARRVRRHRRAVLVVIFGVVAAHLVEIGAYALVYIAGSRAGIGDSLRGWTWG